MTDPKHTNTADKALNELFEEQPLKDFLPALIDVAGKNLRSISWHSDGRVIAKSSAGAKNPRKLYSGSTPEKALLKLIEDNTDE